jgi:EAL domain-containing protein (putative c-di-GMP-specific phosphodiesterase class I)
MKNHINRKFKKIDINNYFVVLLEIANLSTYSQFYDIHLSDYIVNETFQQLKKKLGNNVFLYSANQILVVLEFDNKAVINQLLRNNEQYDKTQKIVQFIKHLKFHPSTHSEYYNVSAFAGSGSNGIREEMKKIDDLIKLAHFSLVMAKQQHKEIVIATEETRIIKEDIEDFNLEIEKGLEADEFNPHFLPILNPLTMEIIGCESLLRWEKNEYRIIEAAKFKEIANEKNLFEKIDKIIIEKSFIAYNDWRGKELISPDFVLTINLSKQSLITIKTHELLHLAKRYQIHPKNIEFDISEQDIFDEETKRAIGSLKENKFQVSIDAFNTNSTNLKTLMTTGVDTIKLSRLTMPGEEMQASEYNLYKTLVKFSKLMGYKVMSKGIESKPQLAVAKELRVDFVQGYYFTPPLNHSNILGFLNKYRCGIHG